MTGVQEKVLCHFRFAAPAMIALLCLFGIFYNKAYTIDDSLFLGQAEQIAQDPTDPYGFYVAWGHEYANASEIIAGGVGMSYILVPTIWFGGTEWLGHLTVVVLALIGVIAFSSLCRTWGATPEDTRLGALAFVTMPTVIAMSMTVMPDIPAMSLGLLGIERFSRFLTDRKWHQAALAILAIASVLLFRSHAVLLLGVMLVVLWQMRARIGTNNLRHGMTVIGIAIVLAMILSFLTSGSTKNAPALATVVYTLSSIENAPKNIMAMLVHYVLVVPFVIPWIALRAKKISKWTLAGAMLSIGTLAVLTSMNQPWWAYLLGFGSLVALIDTFEMAVKDTDRCKLALAVWLLVPLPVCLYLHMPSKYLTISAPAAILLLIYASSTLSTKKRKALLCGLTAYGVVLGSLIVQSDARMADVSRRAAATMIAPRVQNGDTVWFAGDWSLNWYARKAGAKAWPVSNPSPNTGDYIVWHRQPRVDGYPMINPNYVTVVDRVADDDSLKGHTMGNGAGFYSNAWGLLPWTLSRKPTDVVVLGRFSTSRASTEF